MACDGTLPTYEEVQNSKLNIDFIDEWVDSPNQFETTPDGVDKRTIEGINNDADTSIAQIDVAGANAVAQIETDGANAVAKIETDGANAVAQIETDGANAVAQIETDGANAILNVGWDVLGDFTTGVLVENGNDVLRYDGGLYRATGDLPLTTDGDTPDTDSHGWAIVKLGEVGKKNILFNTDLVKNPFNPERFDLFSDTALDDGETISCWFMSGGLRYQTIEAGTFEPNTRYSFFGRHFWSNGELEHLGDFISPAFGLHWVVKFDPETTNMVGVKNPNGLFIDPSSVDPSESQDYKESRCERYHFVRGLSTDPVIRWSTGQPFAINMVVRSWEDFVADDSQLSASIPIPTMYGSPFDRQMQEVHTSQGLKSDSSRAQNTISVSNTVPTKEQYRIVDGIKILSHITLSPLNHVVSVVGVPSVAASPLFYTGTLSDADSQGGYSPNESSSLTPDTIDGVAIDRFQSDKIDNDVYEDKLRFVGGTRPTSLQNANTLKIDMYESDDLTKTEIELGLVWVESAQEYQGDYTTGAKHERIRSSADYIIKMYNYN